MSYKKVDREKINKIKELHRMWLLEFEDEKISPESKQADFTGVDLRGENLAGENLKGANFIKANLTGANLEEADFRGANFIKANLTGANLKGANFRWARLNLAILNGTDLREANFYDTTFIGADLIGADLTGANFANSNLENAKLPDNMEYHDCLPYHRMIALDNVVFIGCEKLTIKEWLSPKGLKLAKDYGYSPRKIKEYKKLILAWKRKNSFK